MHDILLIALCTVLCGGETCTDMALKGNQGTLHQDVSLFLADPATAVAQATQTTSGHGRLETRTARVSADVAWLQAAHQWPGLHAVGQVTTWREAGEGISRETRYYLAFPRQGGRERAGMGEIGRPAFSPRWLSRCARLWVSYFLR